MHLEGLVDHGRSCSNHYHRFLLCRPAK